MPRPVTVYKLGGSLLPWEAWPSRLTELIADGSVRPLVIIGGGAAADVVRDWDTRHNLDPCFAHDLALQAMSLNAAFVSALLPRATLVAGREAAEAAWNEERVPVLDVCEFLAGEASWHEDALPKTWETTSDSIAAWVARNWPARLMLVKSVDWSSGTSLAQAAAAGLVDASFPRSAVGIEQLMWVNLRGEGRVCALQGR